MRVEDGIPTVDLEITATAGEQQFFHYTPGVKVYCSKVTPGRKCTFIMMNGSEIEVVLFPGTTIPLCSRACKFESSVTSGEQLVIFNSKLTESYPVLPGQSAYLVQHCSYKNNQNELVTHHVHIHDTQLVVGKVYRLQLKNGEIDWFTILESHDYTGIEIISVIEGPLDECKQPYTEPSQITSIDSNFDATVESSVITVQSDRDENNDGFINAEDIEVSEWSSLIGDYTFKQPDPMKRPYRATYDEFNVIGFNNVEDDTTRDILSYGMINGTTLLGNDTTGIRDFTVWVVGRMGSLPTAGGYYPILSEGTSYMGISRAGALFMSTSSSSQLTASSGHITGSENFIIQYSNRIDTDGIMTIKKNNTLVATGTAGAGDLAVSTNMMGFSGNDQDSLLFEIIVKKGSTTDTIDEQMTGFLAHKWKLTELLPTDHSYKTTPPGY